MNHLAGSCFVSTASLNVHTFASPTEYLGVADLSPKNIFLETSRRHRWYQAGSKFRALNLQPLSTELASRVIFLHMLALESRKEAYCQTAGLSLSDLQPAKEPVEQ